MITWYCKHLSAMWEAFRGDPFSLRSVVALVGGFLTVWVAGVVISERCRK